MIIGKIPNLSLDGFHTVPKRNFNGPILAIAGIPFANRNKQIRNTARTDAQAATINTIFMACSLNLFIQDSSSLKSDISEARITGLSA